MVKRTAGRGAFLWLVVSCCLFSFSGLGGGYVFDDALAIEGNGDTDPASSFLALWSHDIWGKHMLHIHSHHSYRPLLILVFKLLRTLYDSPVCLRLFSILSHTVATLLFYLMAEEVTGLSDLALDAALLFATHPVHVESVTAVVNMAEPIHCIFYIQAFRIYYQDVYQRSSNSSQPIKRESRVTMYGRWIMCIVCSILFKETGLTVVAVIIGSSTVELLALLLRNGAPDRRVVCRRWWSQHGVWIGLCITTIFCYAATRVLLMKVLQYDDTEHRGADVGVYLESSDLIRKAENPFAFLQGTELVLSLLYLHCRYMAVLVYPVSLCAEYSFDCIPSVKSVLDYRFGLAMCMYLGLLGLVVLGTKRAVEGGAFDGRKEGEKEKEKGKKDSGGVRERMQNLSTATTQSEHPSSLIHALVWMAVSFVPASGVLLRLGTLLAERLLYVPSCGFCLVLAMAVRSLCSLLSRPSRAAAGKKGGTHTRSLRFTPSRAVIVLIWALYLAKSYHQNLVWRDPYSLFSAALETCPRSAKINLQMTKIYLKMVQSPQEFPDPDGRDPVQLLQSARSHLDRAKEVDPEFCDVGYQEALLQILLHQDASAARQALLDNLGCKFTAMNSLLMLESLWKAQLDELGPDSRERYPLLKQHGEMASRAGVPSVSMQKFAMACQEAINHSAYLDALLLCVLSEESLTEWLESEEAAREKQKTGREWAKALEIKAMTYARGGRVRRLVQKALEQGQRGLNEQQQHREGQAQAQAQSVWDSVQISDHLRTQLLRAKELLFAAIAAKEESFLFLRSLSQSDEEARAYQETLGFADPQLVPLALESLEDAVASSLDAACLESAAARGDFAACGRNHGQLGSQMGNLVDYAALQELRRRQQPLTSGSGAPEQYLSEEQIANVYLAAAAHYLDGQAGAGEEDLHGVKALVLKAVAVAGRGHVALTSSAVRELAEAANKGHS